MPQELCERVAMMVQGIPFHSHGTTSRQRNRNRVRMVSNASNEIAHDSTWHVFPTHTRCFTQHLWQPLQKGMDMRISKLRIAEIQPCDVISLLCCSSSRVFFCSRLHFHLPLHPSFYTLTIGVWSVSPCS